MNDLLGDSLQFVQWFVRYFDKRPTLLILTGFLLVFCKDVKYVMLMCWELFSQISTIYCSTISVKLAVRFFFHTILVGCVSSVKGVLFAKIIATPLAAVSIDIYMYANIADDQMYPVMETICPKSSGHFFARKGSLLLHLLHVLHTE